ncbi:mitochondrial import inner membrane translocase subunit Tim29-like [Photinus pyralis]|uniref:mitochondrial import inner membrane translocase subunit Tim29-like n=1 Tax=Photinus pyralis TaxID=7054 RepID=UPI0012673E27|nr:mitochondrial import inner membrane translocase subunit Tim29-like [Photinus pyralis]
MFSFVRELLTSISAKASRTSANMKLLALRVEAKSKGTMFEKWVTFWKSMYLDYKDLVYDIRNDVREEPIKAVCLASLFAAVTYCAKHNPNLVNYRASFVNYANELSLVHPSLQKVEAASTVDRIGKCFARDVVRRLNLGIASVIWIDFHNRTCKNGESTCPYFQMQSYEIKDYIVDVGFLDRWWFLNSCMADYDINY